MMAMTSFMTPVVSSLSASPGRRLTAGAPRRVGERLSLRHYGGFFGGRKERVAPSSARFVAARRRRLYARLGVGETVSQAH
jgi:hypothetical protein